MFSCVWKSSEARRTSFWTNFSNKRNYNFNLFFSSQIVFVQLMVAQKHVRAVSKHSFPLIDVFEIHLVNQEVVFHWVLNSFAWPKWDDAIGFLTYELLMSLRRLIKTSLKSSFCSFWPSSVTHKQNGAQDFATRFSRAPSFSLNFPED